MLLSNTSWYTPVRLFIMDFGEMNWCSFKAKSLVNDTFLLAAHKDFWLLWESCMFWDQTHFWPWNPKWGGGKIDSSQLRPPTVITAQHHGSMRNHTEIKSLHLSHPSLNTIHSLYFALRFTNTHASTVSSSPTATVTFLFSYGCSKWLSALFSFSGCRMFSVKSLSGLAAGWLVSLSVCLCSCCCCFFYALNLFNSLHSPRDIFRLVKASINMQPDNNQNKEQYSNIKESLMCKIKLS